MKTDYNKKQDYIKAKKKVKSIQLFYIHLAGYIILVTLILYNLYIIEEGEYKKTIIALDVSTLVGWTIFIALHGWRVFKGKILFKEDWEDRKINKILEEEEEEETTLWE